MSVVIETTIGDITVDLYLKERPNTCLNFLKLCKMKYYNLCLFYKIEKNFIAQTGDPTATGRGGESVFSHLYGEQAKYFDAEFKPRLKHEKLGTLSMVNNGNNMNGSQFFLTLNENLTYLDENHSVFGEVSEGFDVLQKLNDAICDTNNRPYQDIRITHTVVLHDPFDDPKGLSIPDASPEPTKEMLESNYIGADEEIDDNKGKTAEEIEEKIKESEAKARATILEMVGDIPDAEVKPPENVLFVCKLNPVTTSEDLEIIFSRFGKILSCEVIKDKKSGDSLQYAFIEFEKEEDCEAAYFKMDNVLIDDRRIHVDFSQSVSKMFYDKGKQPNYKAKSNFSLKKVDRNDGYDLIFDTDDNFIKGKASKDNHKSRSEEVRKGFKNYEDKMDNKKRYKDDYQSERYKDARSKSKADFDQSSSRKYKEREGHKMTHESSPKRYKSSEKRGRYGSESPEYRKKIHELSPLKHYKESEKKRRYDSSSPECHKKTSESHLKYNKESYKKHRCDSVSPESHRNTPKSFSNYNKDSKKQHSNYSAPSDYSKKLSESFSKHNKESKKKGRYDSASPDRSRESKKKEKYDSVSPDRSKESKKKNRYDSVSPDRFKKSKKKERYNSVSPDRSQNTSSRNKEQSYEYNSKVKHSDKYDHVKYSRYISQETKKIRTDFPSHKYKTDMQEKAHSSEKSKKLKRKSPTSSSDSSDSDSSSSSSSSSDQKDKYKKQKKVTSSHKKSRSHKKSKL